MLIFPSPAELEQSYQSKNAIIESALDAVVSMDLDGRITGWNSQAETNLRLDRGGSDRTPSFGDDHSPSTARSARRGTATVPRHRRIRDFEQANRADSHQSAR